MAAKLNLAASTPDKLQVIDSLAEKLPTAVVPDTIDLALVVAVVVPEPLGPVITGGVVSFVKVGSDVVTSLEPSKFR